MAYEVILMEPGITVRIVAKGALQSALQRMLQDAGVIVVSSQAQVNLLDACDGWRATLEWLRAEAGASRPDCHARV